MSEAEATVSENSMLDTIGDAFDEATKEAPEEVVEEVVEAAAEETTEAPVEAEAEAVETTEAVEAEEIQDEVQAIEAPVSWDESGRAVWSTLPPEAQEYLTQRESARETDYTQKTQEIADTRRRWDEISGVIEPYRQEIALQGMSEAQAVNQLLALQRFSAQDPVGYIRYAAQATGVNLEELAEQQEYVDPQTQQLQQQINGLQAHIQTTQNQQVNDQRGQLETQVNVFRDEKDADGKSAHPHFDAVRTQMGAIIQGNPETTMQQAYENATWAMPDVRQKMLDEQQKVKVAKAKQTAGKSPKPSGVSAEKGIETPKDMRDTIGSLYDQATAAQ